MSDFQLDAALAFDKNKQSALIGWALLDHQFFRQAVNSIDPNWLADSYLGKAWGACCQAHREFHRRLTPKELKSWPPFLQEDPRSQDLIAKAIKNAVDMTKSYGLDILRKEITSWMRAVIFSQGVQQAAVQYNAQNVDDAWKIMDQAAIKRRTSSFEEGTGVGFRPSGERIITERAERMEESKLILPYGIRYYDDMLGGITPKDLVVIGAKTGGGKSQLATAVSLEVAKKDPAHYFALEAEDGEVERRIKYGLISNEYYLEQHAKGNDRPPEIDYKRWRLGRLDDVFAPIEKRMEDQLVAAVKNLNTLYRNSGTFDLVALEQSLMQIVHETRLIVIDHLHYIDTEGDNENLSYKRIVKVIRDIVLKYGVPVILVAHIRKTQGGFKGTTLLPFIEEFHGTSDVPKIATTCLMMAPARDQLQTEPWLWPTYLGALKCRIDGSVINYVGVTNFNRRINCYEPEYAVGRLEDMGKTWEEMTGREIPHWAEGHKSIAIGVDPDPLEG